MQDTLALLVDMITEGFYLHGSKKRLEIIEPRPARCLSGREEGCQKAVYAARCVEIPCIMAMRTPDGSGLRPQSSYSQTGKGPLIVRGKHMTFAPGYVYALPSETFECMGSELISRVPVMPHLVVPVTPAIIPLLVNMECHIPVPTTW